jgi:hypothetical protein
MENTLMRSRWAALGAAVAVTLGVGGGLHFANAATSNAKTAFVAITPTRIVDTRSNIGLTGKFADGVARIVQVTGTVPVAPTGTQVVVPATATAIVANVTVVEPSAGGFLSVRPGDATGTPFTSNLNYQPGQNIPNSVTVGLTDGKVQVFLGGGTAHVLVDIVGFYENADDRYLPTLTTLRWNNGDSIAASQNFVLAKTIGTFTKSKAESALRLDLSATGTAGANFCQFQLRIDGKATDGSALLTAAAAATQDGNAIVLNGAGYANLNTFGLFRNIAAGAHTAQLFVRSGSSVNCGINPGVDPQTLLITEFVAAP